MDKCYIKAQIIEMFPKLKEDNKFDITSPEDPNYNCIAWAYKLLKNRWMQPPNGAYLPNLDAVSWWPDGVKEGLEIQCLIDAFASIGYNRCSSYEHEDGYIKVALYYNPQNGKWTHAAREGRCGTYWMSKLGPSYDIHHGTPYSIESNVYGKVYCIMKMPDK